MSGGGGGGGHGLSEGAQNAIGYAIAALVIAVVIVWVMNTWRGVPTFTSDGGSQQTREDQYRPVTGGQQYTRPPSPAQIARSAPHRTTREFARCDAGYWQDQEDGTCYRSRWVPGP